MPIPPPESGVAATAKERLNQLRDEAEGMARRIRIDPSAPVKRYYHGAMTMLDQGRKHAVTKDWELAFVLLMRFVTFFLERMPEHPDFRGEATAGQHRALKSAVKVRWATAVGPAAGLAPWHASPRAHARQMTLEEICMIKNELLARYTHEAEAAAAAAAAAAVVAAAAAVPAPTVPARAAVLSAGSGPALSVETVRYLPLEAADTSADASVAASVAAAMAQVGLAIDLALALTSSPTPTLTPGPHLLLTLAPATDTLPDTLALSGRHPRPYPHPRRNPRPCHHSHPRSHVASTLTLCRTIPGLGRAAGVAHCRVPSQCRQRARCRWRLGRRRRRRRLGRRRRERR